MLAEPLHEDPFVTEVFYLLPQGVASRMSPAERSQFMDALSRGSVRSRHRIDLRFSVPLGLSGLYCVFQVGKDRRREKAAGYRDRRRSVASFFQNGALFAFILATVFIGFGCLYWAKSKMGINIFAKDHLRDFIPVNIKK